MLQKFHEAVLGKGDWIDRRENEGDAEVDIKWTEPEQDGLCEGVPAIFVRMDCVVACEALTHNFPHILQLIWLKVDAFVQ